MKDHLIFDITDADTIADSDSVGAYIRAADGTRITHTNDAGNSKDRLDVLGVLADAAGNTVGVTSGALDVNVTSPIPIDVELDGVYDGVTNTDPDNVGVIFHTRNAAPGDIQQVERTTAGGLGQVLSANIGNINAMDTNSFLYAINDTNGNAEQLTWNNTNGGLEVYLTGSDPVTVNDAALANTSIANAVNTLAVASTAEDVVASPLADRKYLYVYNNDNRRIFLGASGVTQANGFPVSPGSYLELRAGAAVDIEWVSPKVGHNIRTLELS